MSGFNVFMKIDGMPGSATQTNRADWSDVRGFSHSLEYPFDMRENKGRGEPVHGALMLIKEIDKSSPKLLEALAKKKKINEVMIEFERDKPGEGSTEVYYSIKLTDCRLVHARPHIPTPAERDKTTPPHCEELGFAYRMIDWTWLSGGQIPTSFNFADPSA
jgi:type VI secretion system secreted protein Hcp